MGLIKAAVGAIGGGLADQWLEVVRADDLNNKTLMVKGVKYRADSDRSSNTKSTDNLISNGSKIHVGRNQCLILIENGSVIDYTVADGEYIVDNSSTPSLFGGEFGKAMAETFDRIRYGGVPSNRQEAVFVNLQEITDIKFGSPTPIQYWDNFYNAELFIRVHGSFSIKVTEPLRLYDEVLSKDDDRFDIGDFSKLYVEEFITALATAINKLSAEGERISFLNSNRVNLANYMSDALDDVWTNRRGISIQSVSIAGLDYDERSRELIDERTQVGMYATDPNLRETYVQTAIARGLEDAGSNEGGAGQAFLGMGIGMQGAGGFSQSSSNFNLNQLQQQQQAQQNQGNNQNQNNQGNNQGNDQGSGGGGKFNFCPNCGNNLAGVTANFCPNCGHKLN